MHQANLPESEGDVPEVKRKKPATRGEEAKSLNALIVKRLSRQALRYESHHRNQAKEL